MRQFRRNLVVTLSKAGLFPPPALVLIGAALSKVPLPRPHPGHTYLGKQKSILYGCIRAKLW